jgi:hypothetical protein
MPQDLQKGKIVSQSTNFLVVVVQKAWPTSKLVGRQLFHAAGTISAVALLMFMGFGQVEAVMVAGMGVLVWEGYNVVGLGQSKRKTVADAIGWITGLIIGAFGFPLVVL